MSNQKSGFKHFVLNVLGREDLWQKLNKFIEQSRPEKDNKESSDSESETDSESEFEGENLSNAARLVLHGMERYKQ